MLDLEQNLTGSSSHQQDLSGRLSRVKASAERIWKEPRLPWFTDHSAQRHSRRVVQMCGSLIERLQEGPEALNPQELYVLLAAAYLHDIGMQDFRIDGRGPEELSTGDYDLIRRRHPERGKALIVERGLNAGRDDFRIEIDDDLSYLMPIALVSQAHGSAYFEPTIKELSVSDYAPENQRLRGPLLSALLLFADELDLHEDRARFRPEVDQSAVTALHHHLNHYVTRVQVGDGKTTRERAVSLSLAFPPGSEHYQGEVRFYIATKLSSQASRINPVLLDETDGSLEIDRIIRMRSKTESMENARRELPESALRLLQLEIREKQIIGREKLTGSVTETIEQQRGSIIELVSGEGSDLPVLLSWLQALTLHREIPTLHADLTIEVATDREDLLEGLLRQNDDGVKEGGDVPSDLAGIIGSAGQYCVLIFEGVDNLLPQSWDWLSNELAALDPEENRALVVLTRGSASDPVVPDAKIHELGALTLDALQRYLRYQLGDDPQQAAERAEEIMALNNGAPSTTLMALSARLNRTWQDDAT